MNINNLHWLCEAYIIYAFGRETSGGQSACVDILQHKSAYYIFFSAILGACKLHMIVLHTEEDQFSLARNWNLNSTF